MTTSKKYLSLALCMLLLLLPVNVKAEELALDETNFPDENFRKALAETAEGKDGKFTEEEIKNLNVLDLKQKEIKDLTGIEHFTALTTLDISQNKLESIDLKENTEINLLDCSENPLGQLDLSYMPELEYLTAADAQLTSLKLPEKMAKIIVPGNKLESFDFSGFKQLSNIDFSENNLSKADFSENIKLYDINLAENAISEINLDKNNEIIKLNLAKNKIAELDLSHMQKLEDLIVNENKLTKLEIDACKALKSIKAYDNEITKLDLSGKSDLQEVNCQSNKIDELDLSSSSKLTNLDCMNNQLSSLDLSNNASLLTVIASHNQLKEFKIAPTAKPESIDLNNNKLAFVNLPDTSKDTFAVSNKAEFDHPANKEFDLSKLEGFDTSKIEKVQGGKIVEGKLKIDHEKGRVVIIDYKVNSKKTEAFEWTFKEPEQEQTEENSENTEETTGSDEGTEETSSKDDDNQDEKKQIEIIVEGKVFKLNVNDESNLNDFFKQLPAEYKNSNKDLRIYLSFLGEDDHEYKNKAVSSDGSGRYIVVNGQDLEKTMRDIFADKQVKNGSKIEIKVHETDTENGGNDSNKPQPKPGKKNNMRPGKIFADDDKRARLPGNTFNPAGPVYPMLVHEQPSVTASNVGNELPATGEENMAMPIGILLLLAAAACFIQKKVF